MTSEIIYIGELRTEATHRNSGNLIRTDAPPDNQGKGEAFSPTDLAATSLGCCMLTVMGIKARDNKIDMDGTKISIKKVMAANPRRISEIHVEIKMPRIKYSDNEKQLLIDTAINCPVALSLHPDIRQVVNFDFEE